MNTKPHWAEIRNDYFCTDFLPESGDVLASVSIDAWKTQDDHEEGKVIAEVLLSTHGDVLVSYHDNLARVNAAAQEAIQGAKEKILTYWHEQQQTKETASPTLKDGVILLCSHETEDEIQFYTSIHPNEEAAQDHLDALKEQVGFEGTAKEYFDYTMDPVSFNPNAFPDHQPSLTEKIQHAKNNQHITGVNKDQYNQPITERNDNFSTR